MAGDAERRFEKIMSRLSPSPSSNRNKSRHGINQLGDGIFGGRMRSESGLRVSATNSRGLVPPCRPWDRGDLMRRMATFKAMTWFAKPQAINPVNCARRGWINVEMDVIACEACGARLLFATPSAWTLQQVEKAAAVFSLKLDNGHRLLCPWIDNTCDEALALFPPTPPPVLVDGYRERAAALLRLTALPVVSLSAIDCMRGPQLELFLSQPSHLLVTWKNGMKLADDPRSKDIPGASKDATAEKYYQAQKIISLCGWEPRLLPYVVDKNDPSKSSAEILVEQESTKTYTANGSSDDSVCGNNNLPSLGEYQYDPAASVVLDCRFCGACVGLWAFTTMQRPLESFTLLGDSSGQNEPDSRCMDLVNGIETSTDESLSKGYQCFTKEDHISATTKGRPLGLNLTIAGGPPPTKQNFRPVVSFPIISRHLSSEMANNFGFGSYVSSEVTFGNQVNSQPNPHDDIQCEQQTDDTGGFSVSPEGSGSCKRKRSEIELNVSESNDVNDVSRLEGEVHGVENGSKILEKTSVSSSKGWSNGAQGTHTLLNENRVNDLKRRELSSENVEENVLHSEQTTNNSVEVGENVCATSVTIVTTPASVAQANNSFADKDHADNTNEDTCSTIDLLNSDGTCEYNQDDPSNIASSSGKLQVDGSNTFQNINDVKNNDQRDVVANMVLATTGRKDDANHASVDTLGDTLQPPMHHNFNEFDPIRQHRPFCPWITPVDGKSLPGWKLTLSALVQQEKDLSPGSLQLDSSSPLLDEEDDPITSIRKLFRSPSSKRPPSKRWKDSH